MLQGTPTQHNNKKIKTKKEKFSKNVNNLLFRIQNNF
jgi:hypothetical protein